MALTIALIGLLVAKELCDATEEPRLHILSRYLGVLVIPLLICFAFLVFMQVQSVP